MSSLTWSCCYVSLGSLRAEFSLEAPAFLPRPSSSKKLKSRSALPQLSTSSTPPLDQRNVYGNHERPIELARSPKSSQSELSRFEQHRASIFHGFQRTVFQSMLSLVMAVAMASNIQGAPSRDTFEDVPQTLSGGDKIQRIQKPKSAKAESCTRKCVSTCIRGVPAHRARVLSMFAGRWWFLRKVFEPDSTALSNAVKSAT